VQVIFTNFVGEGGKIFTLGAPFAGYGPVHSSCALLVCLLYDVFEITSSHLTWSAVRVLFFVNSLYTSLCRNKKFHYRTSVVEGGEPCKSRSSHCSARSMNQGARRASIRSRQKRRRRRSNAGGPATRRQW